MHEEKVPCLLIIKLASAAKEDYNKNVEGKLILRHDVRRFNLTNSTKVELLRVSMYI